MKIRKWLACTLAALLTVGGISLASAAPASAHTSKVTGVANCEADGTYTITWTYNATNVPKHKEAETKATTTNKGSLAVIDGVLNGGQVFLSVWTEHQVNVPGAPVKTGNWSAKFKTVGVPGTYKGDVTTMVQTDWKNGPSEDPVGSVRVDGKCKPPTPKDANAEIVTTLASCEANGTASWSNLVHATGAPLDQTPGSRSGIATSAQGHLFADGQNTKTVPYVIEHKLDPNAPPCFVKPPQPESLKGTDRGSYPPVCVEPKDGTSTTTSWTQDWTQAYVWSDETRTWVLGGKVYAPKVETTGDPVKNPDCKPAPANPKATIEATCGLATVALSNGVRQGLTASFVIFVDGKFYDAYSVAAGAESEVVKITFGEDTGTHVVEVFQAGTSEWKSIAKAKVESDCIPPQPADKKGTEERTLEPVCVDPADGTATVVAQERSWTQTAAWDGKEWVYGAKVYGEWEVVSTSTEPNADCAPPTREPREEITYGEWVGGEPTCEDTEVTQTRTVTVTTTTYGWEFQEGEWVETSASSSSIGEPETRVVKWAGEACPAPTPTQTPTPTTTPTPTPTVPPVSTDDELPPTGGEIVGTLIAGAFGIAALAGGIVLLIRRRQTA